LGTIEININTRYFQIVAMQSLNSGQDLGIYFQYRSLHLLVKLMDIQITSLYGQVLEVLSFQFLYTIDILV